MAIWQRSDGEKEEGEDMKCNDRVENGSDVDVTVAGMYSDRGTIVEDEVREVLRSHIIKDQKVIVLQLLL